MSYRFNRPNYIHRYGQKPVLRRRPKLYGHDHRVIHWNMPHHKMALVRLYRVRPEPKVLYSRPPTKIVHLIESRRWIEYARMPVLMGVDFAKAGGDVMVKMLLTPHGFTLLNSE